MTNKVIDIILSLTRRIGSIALIPVWTNDVDFVARNYYALKDANPVPVPRKKLLDQLVNKFSFIRLAESLGLPTPRTIELAPTLDIQDTINFLGLPMLAKPVIGSGGQGIVEIADMETLRKLVKESVTSAGMILQEKVSGEDIALTLLADSGKVFAVMMRKRWFTRWSSRPFGPIVDIEFFYDSWLNELGQEFVRLTQFSGIADFDLKVDFKSHRAWFLEVDPRMMGGLTSSMLFGINVPWLLVEQTLGRLSEDSYLQPDNGYFLSLRSIPEWILRGAWRDRRRGPIRTNWDSFISDPVTIIYRLFLPP